MDRYQEFQSFVRTIEAGSFTAAAQQLGVAKSAVSRRVSDLEARLGTQLITRTTRTLSLTEAGQTLYQRAVQILADWDEAENAASGSAKSLSGRIKLAAPLSFGLTYLGPAILDFARDHPDIIFDIDFSDRTVDLISEGMDLAIRIGRLPDSGLIARKLAPVQFAAAASPDYLRQFPAVKTLSDLNPLTELRYSGRPASRWQVTDPAGRSKDVDFNAGLSASNGDFLRDAAIAGMGFVIEPTFILCDALRDGSLVTLLPDHRWAAINAYAVYPPTRHLSSRVRAFVDFLAARFGGIPPWDLDRIEDTP